MAVLESDIKALMKTVMSSTMKTVAAAQKTVISPTEVRNITKEILADFESGSIDKFLRALDRSEKIFDKLGLNIKEFNTGLAKRIDQLKEQRDKSAKQVEELRKRNIIAETELNKRSKAANIEVRILTKQEIDARKKQLKAEIKRVDDFERDILVKRETILEKQTKDGFISRADQKEILKDEKKLADDRAKIEKEDRTLNPLADDQGFDRGQQSQFFEELKAPFVAFGDALMAVRDGAMEAYNVFLFFKKGGLMKALKSFRSGIKAIGKFFMTTKVLIGLAVVGVVAAIFFFRDKIASVAKFLVSIPKKIGEFLGKVFTRLIDFYKTMINSVIKLINKIPGINIDLLETSKMKEEREAKERDQRIKEGTENFDSIGTESGFTETETGLLQPKFDEGPSFDDTDSGNQSSVVYDPKSGNAMVLNRQVVGNQFQGAGGDGTGDASTAKTLFQEQQQTSMFDTGEIPSAVVYNNQNTNVGGSNQTITGFITNKNVDNTFLNLSNATP
jgi:hypothetical protein